MQVPQWAGSIPMGRRGGPGLTEGGANALGPRIPVLNNSVVVELHLKIKREPTQSYSRLLRVSK